MKVINISVLTDKIIRLGRRGEGNVRCTAAGTSSTIGTWTEITR